ncbi:MAG: tetratricopeptide repeat protein, partial [Formosimonas sp.]
DSTAQNNQAAASKFDELESIKADSSINDARVLNAEGIRLSKQGNIEQALSIFAQAAQRNPNDGEILGNLSYSYYQLGDYDQSEQVLDRALNLKPKRGASWILMGQLRSVRGDYNGSVDALARYLSFSTRKNAAVNQLTIWANGGGDGANLPVLRQASSQVLINAGY